jgi:hypothetical protein
MLASVAVVIVTVLVQHKANELASLGDSFEADNGCPAPLPATSSYVTGEKAAVRSWPLGPPEGGVTYAAVMVGPFAPDKLSRSVTPTAKGSDPSEHAVPTALSGRKRRQLLQAGALAWPQEHCHRPP